MPRNIMEKTFNAYNKRVIKGWILAALVIILTLRVLHFASLLLLSAGYVWIQVKLAKRKAPKDISREGKGVCDGGYKSALIILHLRIILTTLKENSEKKKLD